MNNVDNIFNKEINEKFSFNSEVASVFDDMLIRSIPYYKDNITLIADVINKRGYKSICDIGCSTGNLLLYLAQKLQNKILIGVDNSNDMLTLARNKANAYGLDIDFVLADILEYEFNSDVVISNYTLQFIRPIERENLLRKIYNSLHSNGAFIMSEKLICHDKQLDKEFIDIYYEFKQQNGYSNTEISKKREALENILVPYSQEENIRLLKNVGFSSIEVLFRWVNFATFIAIK